MTRYHFKGEGVKVPFTAEEEAEADAREATHRAGLVDGLRVLRYEEANAEYVRRGVALLGIKVRGSSPEQVLTLAVVKESYRGGPKAAPLAALHDKLEGLKDTIEAVDKAALDVFDVTADAHWQ